MGGRCALYLSNSLSRKRWLSCIEDYGEIVRLMFLLQACAACWRNRYGHFGGHARGAVQPRHRSKVSAEDEPHRVDEEDFFGSRSSFSHRREYSKAACVLQGMLFYRIHCFSGIVPGSVPTRAIRLFLMSKRIKEIAKVEDAPPPKTERTQASPTAPESEKAHDCRNFRAGRR